MPRRVRPDTEIAFGGAKFAATVAAFALLSAGCGDDEVVRPAIEDPGAPDEGFVWNLPPGFPEPRVPDDNPMTQEKVELGRRLFYDTRISGNRTQSCASCHQQSLAFTDGKPLAVGSTGERHFRSAMNLTNVAYQPVLTWADPTQTSLAGQILIPLFGHDPVELGLAGREDELLNRLRADEVYDSLFLAAFPDQEDPVTIENLTKAVASFERTLISGDSPADRFREGDTSALSESARLGRDLFFSDRLGCFKCHGGLFFTGTFDHEGKEVADILFDNNGLYNLDGNGAYPEPNTGLYRFTGKPEHMGFFKVPTLRNIALTAPYMHDGSIATLDEVLDHYAAGGRTIESGPYAGVGSENPHKSPFITGFTLTPDERQAVLDYLRALTDERFITDPRFSNP